MRRNCNTVILNAVILNAVILIPSKREKEPIGQSLTDASFLSMTGVPCHPDPVKTGERSHQETTNGCFVPQHDITKQQ